MEKPPGLAVPAVVPTARGNPWEEDRFSEAERLRHGWYQPEEPRLAKRYCYRTLAKVDCFAKPRPGSEGRQVGQYQVGPYRVGRCTDPAR